MFTAGGDQALADDMEAWGVPAERIQRRECFGVYEENLEALNFFMRLQTQWVVSPMGERVGLNYGSIEPCARMLATEMTPELFEKVQIMEVTALKEMHNGK